MGNAIQEANRVKFLHHLDESAEAVWKVARWLQGGGRFVTIAPVNKTPNWEDRMKYADGGDLFVAKSLNATPGRVEVKRRGINFTGQDDFPYEDFLVCAKHAWERAEPKPVAIVVLNNAMTHAGVVTAETHNEWTVTTKADRRYQQYSQEFYSVSLDKVKFVSLPVLV